MVITCWGSRGSIAVCGAEYLKYGGDTTCMEIRSKNNDVIIIDAGTGIRKLGIKLLKEKEKNINIIFTHAHWDHLFGFPFFKPIYSNGVNVKLYGCPFAQNSIKEMISKSMSAPNFPVNLNDLKADLSFFGACDGPFEIGPIKIIPVYLSHPNMGIGYKFIEDDKSFVFLTDNELTYVHPNGLEYKDYLEASKNVDLLIHDAEFTESEYKYTKGWGHTVYTDALRLALEADVKQFGLFHHNQERTDEALDNMIKDCNNIIKNQKSNLKCFAVAAGMNMEL
ncbi:MAG: MBL fold metallo-hydrolase [bacterium]